MRFGIVALVCWSAWLYLNLNLTVVELERNPQPHSYRRTNCTVLKCVMFSRDCSRAVFLWFQASTFAAWIIPRFLLTNGQAIPRHLGNFTRCAEKFPTAHRFTNRVSWRPIYIYGGGWWVSGERTREYAAANFSRLCRMIKLYGAHVLCKAFEYFHEYFRSGKHQWDLQCI
jgi:hypothetical protein